MKRFCFALCLALFPALLAQAGEEAFTVRVHHYEAPHGPRAARQLENFQGRQWDLRHLLSAQFDRTQIQWLSVENEREGSADGASYCVRVTPPALPEGRAPAVVGPERQEAVHDLLTQLRLRSGEMKAAHAYYRIEYPSPCGAESERVAHLSQPSRHSKFD